METIRDCNGNPINFTDPTGHKAIKLTKKNLRKFGWKKPTKKLAKKFNKALKKYGITNKHSIRMFMATCAAESEYGRYTIEQGSDSYFAGKNYGKHERGAGYIQITWEGTHKKFLKSVGSKFSGYDTASHISKNYAIEASAWYWSTFEQTSKNNLNAYVAAYGGAENIFLSTQYFVNGGWQTGLSDDLGAMRTGTKYKIKGGKLQVNGHKYNLPQGWTKRKKAYKKAKKHFN